MTWEYILLGVFIFLFFVLPTFVAWYLHRREQETERLRALAKYVLSDFRDFQNHHEDYSEAKALRKFFSNMKNLKKAFEEEMKEKNLLGTIDDNEHKRNVVNRVFAYDYEETIYEIFSKRAYYFEPKYPTEKIEFRAHSIKQDDFIKELSLKLHITQKEANELFIKFLNKQIIYKWKNDECSIGYTLTLYWNVVSQNDLNFHRWMEAHPEIEAEKINLEEIIKNKRNANQHQREAT